MRRRPSVVLSLLLLLLAAGCVEMPGCGYGVDFSPNGEQIALMWVSPKGDFFLCTMNADGSGVRTIPHSEDPGPPLWSPDGRYILFSSGTDLYLYTPTQRVVRKIAAGVTPGFYVWNSDGTQIICLSTPASKSNDPPAQVLWINVPSGEVVLRADLPEDVELPGFTLPRATVAYLPATWGIAFISSKANVYTVEAGKVYRITSTGDVSSLWVSPDGTRLRWVRAPEHSATLVVHEYDLASRTVTGTPVRLDLRRLPRVRGYTLGGTWGVLSPDGQKMLIVAECRREVGKAHQVYNAVYLADLARHSFRLLRQEKPSAPEERSILLPFWSGDGSRIAVLTYGKVASLWVGRGDGSGGRLIRHTAIR